MKSLVIFLLIMKREHRKNCQTNPQSHPETSSGQVSNLLIIDDNHWTATGEIVERLKMTQSVIATCPCGQILKESTGSSEGTKQSRLEIIHR